MAPVDEGDRREKEALRMKNDAIKEKFMAPWLSTETNREGKERVRQSERERD